jgi:hypothetical protein
MKSVAISTILGVVAAAAFAGTALVAPAQHAHAGKAGSARATTTGSKINTGMRAAPKLTCVGPHCRPRPGENRAAPTGVNKATGIQAPPTWTAQGKAPSHKHNSPDPASWPGGVKVSGGTRNVAGLPRCSRFPRRPCFQPWGSQPGQKIRDHRGPPVVPKEDPRQKW